MFSVVSAGCFFWLQRLQPLFFTIAVGALAYELWLVGRKPAAMRKPAVRTVLALSSALNVIVVAGWFVLLLRYR